MTIVSKKEGQVIVKSCGRVDLVREHCYGFRCNSLSTIWFVRVDGIKVGGEYPRRKDVIDYYEKMVTSGVMEK